MKSLHELFTTAGRPWVKAKQIRNLYFEAWTTPKARVRWLVASGQVTDPSAVGDLSLSVREWNDRPRDHSKRYWEHLGTFCEKCVKMIVFMSVVVS